MTPRKPSNPRSRRSVATGSWLALLAATTLGDGAGTVHAEVRADGVTEGAYRLVVQSYDVTDGGVPGNDARPMGSAQRAVTADELRAGVRVNLLELRASQVAQDGRAKPMVVAWIEAGQPDLEFDGRRARPTPGSVYGVGKRDAQGAARVRLDRVAA